MEPKTILITIFLTIGLGILILAYWNRRSLKWLIKNRQASDAQLNDAKYYEYNIRMNLL